MTDKEKIELFEEVEVYDIMCHINIEPKNKHLVEILSNNNQLHICGGFDFGSLLPHDLYNEYTRWRADRIIEKAKQNRGKQNSPIETAIIWSINDQWKIINRFDSFESAESHWNNKHDGEIQILYSLGKDKPVHVLFSI